MRPKPEEYAAPLAGLSAEAQLLVAASELLHAEFDAARSRLEAAWRSLDGGKLALPLVARVETVASILRTAAGKPAEGLALAERAAETFAVTGHPVDAARVEFAKGLAEMAAGNTHEGSVSLRRARGAFARAGSWGAFALTVTALAVAETGPGDGAALKGLFRASLGRLRRAGALDAFQFLRAIHRVILLTRRDPKRRKRKGTLECGHGTAALRTVTALPHERRRSSRRRDRQRRPAKATQYFVRASARSTATPLVGLRCSTRARRGPPSWAPIRTAPSPSDASSSRKPRV